MSQVIERIWTGAGTSNAPATANLKTGMYGADNGGTASSVVYQIILGAWVSTGATIAEMVAGITPITPRTDIFARRLEFIWTGTGTTSAPAAAQLGNGTTGADSDGVSTGLTYHVIAGAWVATGGTVQQLYGGA